MNKVTPLASLQKGNRKAESRHGHKGFEVSIARDERCLVIEAALGDKGIGKIRSGPLPESFQNLEHGKFENRLFERRAEIRITEGISFFWFIWFV